ncbi:MAG: putative toxin-antitoxin system toxin component, PIN family [Acidobacteria bacterium]|nr:putative toxin-antitoxin system toxin component, PIN family [Acidobacteriota bacterium]
MRVVLDTNILISACWKPGGLERQLVDLALAGHFDWVATQSVMDEYVEVLNRPKFKQLRASIDTLLERFAGKVRIVPVAASIALAHDPDDNLLLEAAQAAAADFLVTGNLKDYPLDWPVARIVNARQFFELVQVHGLGGAVVKPIE